jgi:hypothetical protein
MKVYGVTTSTGTRNGKQVWVVHAYEEIDGQQSIVVEIFCDVPQEQARLRDELTDLIHRVIQQP